MKKILRYGGFTSIERAPWAIAISVLISECRTDNVAGLSSNTEGKNLKILL